MQGLLRPLIALSPLLLLGACAFAEPARTLEMVATVSPTTTVPEGSPLRRNVDISEVHGGQETDSMGTSEVSNAAFADALTMSLTEHGLLSDGSGSLQLDANLVAMDQPVFGHDMTVTSTVVYRIKNVSGDRIFDEIITSSYTAKAD